MKITIIDIIVLLIFACGMLFILYTIKLETFFACMKAFMVFQILIVGLLLKIFIKGYKNV